MDGSRGGTGWYGESESIDATRLPRERLGEKRREGKKERNDRDDFR